MKRIWGTTSAGTQLKKQNRRWVRVGDLVEQDHQEPIAEN